MTARPRFSPEFIAEERARLEFLCGMDRYVKKCGTLWKLRGMTEDQAVAQAEYLVEVGLWTPQEKDLAFEAYRSVGAGDGGAV